MGRQVALALLVMSLGCWHLGCQSIRELSDELGARSESASTARRSELTVQSDPSRPKPDGGRSARSLLEELRYCEVRHRGILIDPGSDWGDAHRSFQMTHSGPRGSDDVDFVERAGSTQGRVKTRKLEYDFWLDQSASGVFVSFEAQRESARNLALFLDGTRIGTAKLPRGRSKVFMFGPHNAELSAGRHVLTFRAVGGSRVANTPQALLGWVRVFLPDNGPETYLPAVKSQVLHDVVVGSEPRRALALRSPGSVRCSVLAFEGARVSVDIGYWGVGEGSAQVRAITADGRRITLAERRVVGAPDSKWLPLELSLDALSGQLIGLEFVALEASSSGRVVFGEPRLLSRRSVRPSPPARNVVLIVAGGLSRSLIPPWGPRQGRGALAELAEKGTVFEGYRTNSTVVTGVMATLLTGATPEQHMVLDPAARVPKALPLISELIRKNGGKSVMFTNVPYSFRAFGFDRGWDRFQQLSPVEDRPVGEPFTLAAQWLSKDIEEEPERQRLVVLHVRGGHPPWDVSTEELKVLPPKDYGGILEARRGATILREVRNRRSSSRRRLGPRDQLRLNALQDVALRKQDAGLASIVRVLQDAGQLDQTLLAFVGDVAMGDPPDVPFIPLGKLQSARLMPPLVVRFPRAVGAVQPATGGGRDSSLTTPRHLSRTIFDALGLSSPELANQPSLQSAVFVGAGVSGYDLLARQGHRYAYYVGPWRLRGTIGEKPGLCNVEVDPACQNDVFDLEPRVSHWMWRGTLRKVDSNRPPPDREREAAELDEATTAALVVYGL